MENKNWGNQTKVKRDGNQQRKRREKKQRIGLGPVTST